MMAASNKARIEAYIGASGSGKGVSINRRLAELNPPRLLIWDMRAEYAKQARQYSNLRDLVQAFETAGAGPIRARYVPGANVKPGPAFDLVCRLAFQAGDLVMLAEELSEVTSASWAPPAWRQCITQGRHVGLHLLGATQRPALIDKTFIGNATRIRCGALGYEADRRVMAVELDTTRDRVAQLAAVALEGGGARLEMLERDRQTRTLESVFLTVSAAGRVSERRVSVGL